MVDLYNNKTVIEKGLSGPRASGADFGAGIGSAISGFGQVGQSLSEQTLKELKIRREKEDIAKVVELESSLSDFNRKMLNEDIYTRQGKNALGSGAEYEKSLDKWKKKAERNLSSENQTTLFNQMYLRNRSSHMDSVASHEAREKVRWQDETTVIRASGAIDDALANYTNEKLVSEAYNSGLAAIKGNYYGRDELMGQKVKEFKSEFHKLGTLRRAEDDADLAKEYYEEHKNDIAGKEQQLVEKILQEKKIFQEEIPIKLKEKEMKMMDYEIKLRKFEKQKAFDVETQGMNDIEALKYLENNEYEYSSNWYKAKQKSLLSAKGITSETRKELASDLLLKVVELGSLSDENYLREADDLLTELENEYANGEVTLQDKIRLQNQVLKAREGETIALGEKADEGRFEWAKWWKFDWKDANDMIVSNVSLKRDSSKVMLEYFRTVDGQDLKGSAKRKILDGIIKAQNEKAFQVPMFQSEEEAEKAFIYGKIKKGDKVYINGVRGTI